MEGVLHTCVQTMLCFTIRIPSKHAYIRINIYLITYQACKNISLTNHKASIMLVAVPPLLICSIFCHCEGGLSSCVGHSAGTALASSLQQASISLALLTCRGWRACSNESTDTWSDPVRWLSCLSLPPTRSMGTRILSGVPSVPASSCRGVYRNGKFPRPYSPETASNLYIFTFRCPTQLM